jgi:hypothetical protein
MRHEETGGAQETNTSHVTSHQLSLFSLEPVLEFLNNLWRLGTKSELGFHTGPPRYSTWAGGIDSLESIDSRAPFVSDDSREK